MKYIIIRIMLPSKASSNDATVPPEAIDSTRPPLLYLYEQLFSLKTEKLKYTSSARSGDATGCIHL